MLHSQLSIQECTSLSWLVAYFSLRLGPVEVVGLVETAYSSLKMGPGQGDVLSKVGRSPGPVTHVKQGRANFSKTFIFVFQRPGLI